MYSALSSQSGRIHPETEQSAMPEMQFQQLADLALDPANGWSIGSFGALGEFVREADEVAEVERTADGLTIATARGALCLRRTRLLGLAWESLSSDGCGWGHQLALCVEHSLVATYLIAPLGFDHEAARSEDRGAWLFDLGVTSGCVRMCIRTRDAGLAALLDAAAGEALLDRTDLLMAILRSQPHRVLLSPAGRIEVYQPIPGPHGTSPAGPHTHLLPKLIARCWLHSVNDPIPAGWQAALSMHPPAPWRETDGKRQFASATVVSFAPLLRRYESVADAAIGRSVRTAILAGNGPHLHDWPADRRSRAKARIVLRHLAAAGCINAADWRHIYDRRGHTASSPEEPYGTCGLPATQTFESVRVKDMRNLLQVCACAFHLLDRQIDDDLRPLASAGLEALQCVGEQCIGRETSDVC